MVRRLATRAFSVSTSCSSCCSEKGPDCGCEHLSSGLGGGCPPGRLHAMTRRLLLLGCREWKSSGALHWDLAGSRKAPSSSVAARFWAWFPCRGCPRPGNFGVSSRMTSSFRPFRKSPSWTVAVVSLEPGVFLRRRPGSKAASTRVMSAGSGSGSSADLSLVPGCLGGEPCRHPVLAGGEPSVRQTG